MPDLIPLQTSIRMGKLHSSRSKVSLGRWKGWAMDNPHTGLFEGGERCFSGIVRSLRVTFECGEDYAIESSPWILCCGSFAVQVSSATLMHFHIFPINGTAIG